MKIASLFVFVSLLFAVPSMAQTTDDSTSYEIACDRNAFVTSRAFPRIRMMGTPTAMVTPQGLAFYKDNKSSGAIYFYMKEPCNAQISIKALGMGNLKISYGNQEFKVAVDSKEYKEIEIGKIAVTSPSYVRVDFQAIDFKDDTWPLLIKSLIVKGISEKPLFISANFSSHFGRRGPSVHLNYRLPKGKNIEWFYNEITVPEEGDIVGSYYCAQSFNCGYFGFQHNSEISRRILFSIWSPHDTQNPNDIPEEARVMLVKKGKDVTITQFGNEGSGAQSYLEFPWEAGSTYRFMMHIEPTKNDSVTRFTAYFLAPEEGQWRLIASFDRPKTKTWMKYVSSFLENFMPEQGYLTRKAFYGNAWAVSDQEEWFPIQEAMFTYDDTGRNGIRVDYWGGSDGENFYLKMGGFFGNGSSIQPYLKTKNREDHPSIDFKNFE